jgi:hypothetical protein
VSREIDGRRALACVAEFRQGNKNMVEYFVWVRSDKTLAQFFIKSNAEKLESIKELVEPIVSSVRIP